jgi:hypothetical protein
MGKWTHIRVQEETADWLRAEALHLAGLVARGLIEVDHVTDRFGAQPGTGISADQVIRRLIRQAVRHRNRSRRRRGHQNEALHNSVQWCAASKKG